MAFYIIFIRNKKGIPRNLRSFSVAVYVALANVGFVVLFPTSPPFGAMVPVPLLLLVAVVFITTLLLYFCSEYHRIMVRLFILGDYYTGKSCMASYSILSPPDVDVDQSRCWSRQSSTNRLTTIEEQHPRCYNFTTGIKTEDEAEIPAGGTALRQSNPTARSSVQILYPSVNSNPTNKIRKKEINIFITTHTRQKKSELHAYLFFLFSCSLL